MLALVIVTDRMAEGTVSGSFHFPSAGKVNNLAIRALDSVARIPEYKVGSVRIAPARVGNLVSPAP